MTKEESRLKFIEYVPSQKGRKCCRCKCNCGNEIIIPERNLKNGHTKSCGCIAKELLVKRNLKHGLKKHKFYNTWKSMISRCYNEKIIQFEDYGGRGISVCEEWRNDPTVFCAWCDNQEIPKGYSLDRIDNNGNYCPDNCHFASDEQQNKNSRHNVWIEYSGERLVFKDFVEKYGKVSYKIANSRVYIGWSYEDAALIPNARER